MRKFTLLLILLPAILFKIYSQSVKKGNFLIDGYYGFGTLTSWLAKAINSGSTSAKAGFIGPTGLRVAYLTSDKVALGVDLQYNNLFLKWSSETTDSLGAIITHTYNVQWQRLRIMPKINIMFGVDEKNAGYFALFAGYTFHKFNVQTNDLSYKSNWNIPGFSFRLAAGIRHFHNDNFGFFGELGVFGGALLHAGITIKL
ncbi:MAG: hypothetical protein N3F09_06915 [Bacteroidia bacterium]|nr:hypothetical protein [Bacteroidia bacterium]